MKKEYLSTLAKNLSEKSDTELVDLIADTPSSEYVNKIETAKAILDKRMKRSLQYLTEVIQKSNTSAEKYNKMLAKLTKWILLLTIVITVATIISIVKG